MRREEGGGHAHHGGAWKVAYADFVTAMMAFFLLMWLINATTEEQRRGIADYFNPTNVMSSSQSGSGRPFGGQTPNDDAALMSTTGTIQLQTGKRPVVMDIDEDDSQTPAEPVPRREGPQGQEDAENARLVIRTPPGALVRPEQPRGGPAAEPSPEQRPENVGEAELRQELAKREREAFEAAAEQIREAVRSDPALTDLGRQLLIEQTPEGMRIQLVDAERQPMFALGGAAPNDRARALLQRVAQVIQRLPNTISIAGHTDSTPFRGGGERSNWDLSTERANVTRRLLVEAGVADNRIKSLAGHAERDLLIPDQPTAAANRRVSITLISQAPGTPRP
ncbi:MAG: OmpA family protein [Alphaproteobacteria bacterium]|nr:OmpA family protein [Alphaproteobacteria bacterium]